MNAARYFIEQGVDLNAKAGSDDYTALHNAAKNGKLNTVKLLVEHGANIHAITTNGVEPIYLAAMHGNSSKTHAQPTIQIEMNYWFLCVSVEGHADVIEYLIDSGANVNVKEDLGWTPLLVATRHGKIRLTST